MARRPLRHSGSPRLCPAPLRSPKSARPFFLRGIPSCRATLTTFRPHLCKTLVNAPLFGGDQALPVVARLLHRRVSPEKAGAQRPPGGRGKQSPWVPWWGRWPGARLTVLPRRARGPEPLSWVLARVWVVEENHPNPRPRRPIQPFKAAAARRAKPVGSGQRRPAGTDVGLRDPEPASRVTGVPSPPCPQPKKPPESLLGPGPGQQQAPP